jgi:membrane protein DedA with SNARE-associated domain/rhodanese-related sulfurtransferase
MQYLVALIEQYGLAFVFINVLAVQAGIPVPAYPALIITGAFLARGGYSAPQLLATAVLASLLADFGWYHAGRRYGGRVLKTLCRISLSPDSCVRQTESIYARWGSRSLLVAKFIPGFASVATALAGIVGTKRWSFLLYDAGGAALWAAVPIGLGYLFRAAVDDLIAVLEQLGKFGVLLIAAGFAIFIATKWWQRRRFYKELRMARISVGELYRLIEEGQKPMVLDVRTPASQERDGRIPGALPLSDADLDEKLADVSRDGEVIVYCSCPNEVTAARVAKLLMQRGFHKVRPLHGGIDAWVAAGFGVER